uniref:Synaptotagmin-like protein 2 n=1 Tax=Callorhinchus milii TaxID=7868 RepID=A0A4W3IUC7_CALMI
MIDLSYLTEEEQEKIMSVLQRDGDLKRAEEKRIRRLKQSIEDENQLKYMTGEWFYKAKSKRHADTIHGAELIRASMRKKKPMTIYERIQAKELKEKTKSFMNNVGNSIYATPALSVLLKEEREEELEMEKSLASEASNLNKAVPEQPRQKQKHSSASSPKQRENPFNKSSLLVDDNPNGGQKPLLSASILPGSETPAREWLSQQKDVSRLHLPSNEFLESEILSEKDASKRTDPAFDSPSTFGKQILHYEIESPQVSDLQPTEVFQGKRVSFGETILITTPKEQRHKGHSTQSQMDDKYAADQINATDQSISKVLDWFTRSEEVPSFDMGLEETKTTLDPFLEIHPKAVTTLHAEPDAESQTSETNAFAPKHQVLPSASTEIQDQYNQKINAQKFQAPIKSLDIPGIVGEPLLEERKQNEDLENASPVSKNAAKHVDTEQQHIEFEQDKKQEQPDLPTSASYGGKEITELNAVIIGQQSEDTQSISPHGDNLLAAASVKAVEDSTVGLPALLDNSYLKNTEGFDTKESPEAIEEIQDDKFTKMMIDKLPHLKESTMKGKGNVSDNEVLQEDNEGNSIFAKNKEQNSKPSSSREPYIDTQRNMDVNPSKTLDPQLGLDVRKLEEQGILEIKDKNTIPKRESSEPNIGIYEPIYETTKPLPDIGIKGVMKDRDIMLQQLSPEKKIPNQENKLSAVDKEINPKVTDLPSPNMNMRIMQIPDLDLKETKKDPFDDEAIQQNTETVWGKEEQGLKLDVSPLHNREMALSITRALDECETNQSNAEKNVPETNISQRKYDCNVPELDETSNKKVKNENDAKNEKPFTILSMKKRKCEVYDGPPFSREQFTSLKKFWETERHDEDQTESPHATSDPYLIVTKPAAKSESHRPPQTEHLATKKPIPTLSSTLEMPGKLWEIEGSKAQLNCGPTIQERMQEIFEQAQSPTEEKKWLNPKSFPKVLPTELEGVQKSKKKVIKPSSDDIQDCIAEVVEGAPGKTINQTKLKGLNSLNIGLEKSLQEETDESEAQSGEKPEMYNSRPENPAFVLSKESPPRKTDSEFLSDDRYFTIKQSELNSTSEIQNTEPFTLLAASSPVEEEDPIPEKKVYDAELLDNSIQRIREPVDVSCRDAKLPIRQNSSSEISNNEENLTLFAGHTPVTEENDIPKKRVTSVEPLDSRIQRNLNPTDLSHQEKKISPNTSDNNSEYDEEEMAMDVDKKGLELQDTFQAGLNLPSGVRKTSTFKESDLDSLRKPSEVMESIMPYYSLQEELPKATLPTDSGRGDQSSSETWKNSPTGAEMAALKRRESRTSETSRSLQDIYSTISQPRNLDPAKNEMVLSTNDVSKFPPSSQRQSLKSDKMKRLSKSEQVLPEQIGGSVMSIYSGDFRNDVKGRLQFSLDYIDKLNEFHIFVVRCSDLAAAEEKKNRSDPYVKTYLLQEKIKLGKKKTSVKKKTLNPVYNEILRYKVEKSILMAQILNLSVWHNDRFGHNSFLGEVEIEMKAWDWKNKKMEWYDLKPRTSSANSLDNRGNLKVALRHIPKGSQGNKTGEVHIWVKEAINLPQIRKSGVDPFVKCFILPDTSRKSRQKTRVVKKNPNPKFNHTMVYDGLRPDDLKDACIELSVWDHDKLVNHFLGGLRIGLGKGKSYGIPVDWMDSTEEEAFLWNKMLMEPNVWVENMLPLRMIMLSKMSGK